MHQLIQMYTLRYYAKSFQETGRIEPLLADKGYCRDYVKHVVKH